MHLLVLVDTDKTQHERLVKTLNSRRYTFNASRNGYCRPHVSEVKLYNIRCKKEIAPFVMKDLGGGVFFDEKPISLWKVIKGVKSDKKAFLTGRLPLFVNWFLQKVSKFTGLKPVPVAERQPLKLVDGWFYAYGLAKIDDIDRGYSEEI